jgi:hypothetical protein
MQKAMLAVLAAVICGAAQAKPTYDFQPGWDDDGNNDQNNPQTNQPYTQSGIKTFLEGKKDKHAIPLGDRLLANCGEVQVRKGCHQATDRHVTIYVDDRVNSNKVKACADINTGRGVHVDGC